MTTKTKLTARLFHLLTCHRAIYAGLCLCHGQAALLTDKPVIYAPMAVLYLILSLRG